MRLDRNTKQMAASLARLSSGSKIVSPQDDAAGLAQSMRLDTKITRLDASISNNTNFRSMLQTQDGLAQRMQSALLRMNELSVLHADMTKTAADKAAYELEFNQLDAGIFDMAGKEFNGVDLFFTDGKVFTGDSAFSTLDDNNIADGLGRGANGDYKIEIKFETNAAGTELEAKHKALVERAARRVEAMITGDVSGGQAIDNTITVKLKDTSDGVGNNLASAGMSTAYGDGTAASGQMTIDEADLDAMITGGYAYGTYIHEIMHAVGFSSSHPNFPASNGTATYNGANAIAQYNEIMGTSVTTLNIEDGGGAGTAGSHWEQDDFSNELMTGWVSTGATPLSKVTVGALEDLGYEVDYNAADPWFGPGTGTGPAGGTVIGSVESVKGAIQGLANYRAQIGAQLSYTNKVNSALTIEKENMMQATSRIKDVDIANEATQYAKNNILVQSATAMTAQANLLPQMVLQLIG